MSLARDALTQKLNDLLDVAHIADTSLNGLQVQGKAEINALAFAVTANQYTIQRAVELAVDGLIVHHGLFWQRHVQTITQSFYGQIAPLIKHDISLWGYHLPLDGHPEVGNNGRLAQLLNLQEAEFRLGPPKEAGIAARGKLPAPLSPEELKTKLTQIMHHPVLYSPVLTTPPTALIEQVIIVSGGGAHYLSEMELRPNEAVITGEASQHHWHYFPERGHPLFLVGHEASEVFGVQALAQICQAAGIKTAFIADPNPL